MDMGPAGEQERLEALHALEILDTPGEQVFDRFCAIAAKLCETPIATISLIDADRQWFKAKVGLDVTEVQLARSFCRRTMAVQSPVVIEDALKDPEYKANPFVTGPPHLRFYAGAPLATTTGLAVGTLAVMDYRPRPLEQAKLDLLVLLADQVMTHLELRKQRIERDRALAARDELNAQLATQARRLEEAQRIAQIGSWEMELPSRQLVLSRESFRIFGAAEREEPVDFSVFMSSVHFDDRAGLEAGLEQAIKGRAALDFVHRIVRPGGEVRLVRQRGELRDGGPAWVAGTVEDVTEEFRSKAALQLLHACISRVSDIVMITEACPCDDPGPRIVFVNQAFEERTGYSVAEAIGRSPRFLQGPKTQRAELDKVRAAIERGEHVSVEVINYRKDGSEFWVEIDIAPVFEGGQVTHFVSVQRDTTQRKESEKKIEQLAFFDPLTHLPNRRLFMDRLNHALRTVSRRETCGAVLFLDLDNFKSVNDTLGHEQGDMLLRQVAQNISRVVRASNTVARIGGDEFVVLIDDLSSDKLAAATQAEHVAEKVMASFQESIDIEGHEHNCTASIGVIVFCADDKVGDDLLKRADVAMYQAKAAGRNAIRFFDKGMQSVVEHRVALERELRSSLRRGEFVLHYQPQVDRGGVVVGAEALVRWRHPERGLLYPSTFIALAEETRLILQLGQWVLEAACRDFASWLEQPGSIAPRIAINVSPQQFHHPDFVRRTLQVVEAAGVDPHRVKLELSESVIVENVDTTAAKMRELKRLGVRFSLDDFGTGYSSLSYLKRLPVDEIKIDKAFVRDILDDPDDAAIVRTIVALCQILDFDIIAEGVETEGQRDFLAGLGCAVYQGHLYSAARPVEQL